MLESMKGGFQQFIQGGRARTGPQRLLLAFLYVQQSENAEHSRAMSLQPLMMTHQRLLETLSFNALVAEADHLDERWEFLLLGCMDEAPEATIQTRLREIAHKLATGNDLSDFLILDRQEHSVVFEAPSEAAEPA
ncbi:MAG: hypothetical protein L0H73_00045 [Nitrococcus sp.]|nr:hypothetical protein [Nitrococcus sp.]